MMGDLFASVEKVEHSYSVAPLSTSIKTVKIEMSFFEIYNETLNDLVGPYQDLRVRESPRRGVYVEGLAKV